MQTTRTRCGTPCGIIGTGGRGRRVGSYFAEDPRVRLAAICDIYSDRVDEAKTQIPTANDAKVYKDYKELLASREIDAVLIATPVFLQPEHFEADQRARNHGANDLEGQKFLFLGSLLVF